MSYEFLQGPPYPGSVFSFSSPLGGLATHAANGGQRTDNKVRGVLGAMHGIGLLISLVAGFGLMARLGVSFPGWAVAKIVIWLGLGAALAVPNRRPRAREAASVLAAGARRDCGLARDRETVLAGFAPEVDLELVDRQREVAEL